MAMKFVICVPVLLDTETTKRSDIKDAGKRKLIELARDPQAAANFLRKCVDDDSFLVRAPEAPPKQKAGVATSEAAGVDAGLKSIG